MSGRGSLPGTTKAKLVFSPPADHGGTEIAQEDPEVRLAAESSLRARTLQERCPDTCARALHQQGAQTDRRSCRYLLDGIELACTNFAKAARQEQVPNQHVC